MAIDSSKFKAVNSRDWNFTPAKIDKRKQQIEESIERYLAALDRVDRTLPLMEFGPKHAICITEGIPIKDITPDEIKIGIMPGHIHRMEESARVGGCLHRR